MNYIEYTCIKSFKATIVLTNITHNFDRGNKYFIKPALEMNSEWEDNYYHSKDPDVYLDIKHMKFFKETKLLRNEKLDNVLKKSLIKKLFDLL